jgi:hypothetical protein
MYEKCLNETELILSTQKEPLVPVRKVWEEVNRIAKLKGFDVASMADFSAMLEGDRRFQIIPASIKSQEDEDAIGKPDFADDEMENLGFYSEDRVKMRNRRIVETAVNEDDEEVGSIKRRAFVSRVEKESIAATKNRSKSSSKKSSPRTGKKIKSVRKTKLKQGKVRGTKSKSRKSKK